jgi:hypothetical protein
MEKTMTRQSFDTYGGVVPGAIQSDVEKPAWLHKGKSLTNVIAHFYYQKNS